MKIKEYEQFIVENAKQPLDDIYSVIGLTGEAGEVAEWVKKAIFRKDDRHTEEMLKLELGDVLYYATRLILHHGWTIKEILSANMEKLIKKEKK